MEEIACHARGAEEADVEGASPLSVRSEAEVLCGLALPLKPLSTARSFDHQATGMLHEGSPLLCSRVGVC